MAPVFVCAVFAFLSVGALAHPLTFYKNNRQVSAQVQDVPCGGGESCPDGNTCCSLGCCPRLNAVCCSDGEHCCPSGYSCGATNCKPNSSIHPLRALARRPTVEPAVLDVPCGDGTSCADGTTCCADRDISHACCPGLNAVCCSDGVYCCPSGFTCSGEYCQKDGSIHPLLTLARRPAAEPAVQDVPCSDGGLCDDGNTCCAHRDGSYGCCPELNAVCCSDGKHCCPSGYTCGATYCQKDDSIHPLRALAHRPAAEPAVVDVPCGDGTSCADGTTCCADRDISHACCPGLNAVCCSDGVYCCPSGYTCSSEHCQKDGSIHPLLTLAHRPAAEPAVQDVPCGDGACPDENTCCYVGDDSYGCCPKPNAVCCSDNKHCCPAGYTCDTGDNYCTRNGSKHPLLELAIAQGKRVQ